MVSLALLLEAEVATEGAAEGEGAEADGAVEGGGGGEGGEVSRRGVEAEMATENARRGEALEAVLALVPPLGIGSGGRRKVLPLVPLPVVVAREAGAADGALEAALGARCRGRRVGAGAVPGQVAPLAEAPAALVAGERGGGHVTAFPCSGHVMLGSMVLQGRGERPR